MPAHVVRAEGRSLSIMCPDSYCTIGPGCPGYVGLKLCSRRVGKCITIIPCSERPWFT